MRVDLEHRPSYGTAVVTLDAGEVMRAEAGSMVAMTSGWRVTSVLNGADGGVGGWLRTLLVAAVRRVFGRQTLFVNRFEATAGVQRVWLAPTMPGDILHLRLDGTRRVTAQAGSFLAASPGVSTRLVWSGWSMMFSGEGVFFLECTGEGDLLLASYGAVEEIAVDGGYVVDSGHVVAMEGDLSWSLSRAGGSWRSALLSGEGWTQTFQGQGVVWLQTRQVGSFVGWVGRLLP